MLLHLNIGGTGSKIVIMSSTLKSHKTVPMLIIKLKIVHIMLNSVAQLRIRDALIGSRMNNHTPSFMRDRLRRLAMERKAAMVVMVKGFPWMLMVKNSPVLLSRL